jgi:hypothetical protein
MEVIDAAEALFLKEITCQISNSENAWIRDQS